jgi:hypothetical protein
MDEQTEEDTFEAGTAPEPIQLGGIRLEPPDSSMHDNELEQEPPKREEAVIIPQGNDFLKITYGDFDITLSSRFYNVCQLADLAQIIKDRFYKKNKCKREALGIG